MEIMVEVTEKFGLDHGRAQFELAREIPRVIAAAYRKHRALLKRPKGECSMWWVYREIAAWLGHAAFRANGVGGKRRVYNLWWRRCMCAFAFAKPKTSELE